jgi:HlyD family secretion protein
MNHHHRHLFSLACLASPFIALLTGCSRDRATAYQGYVEGKFVYVASPQSGRLDRVSVNRGATISPNQPLFTLDREPELSAEMQARQVLRSDERRLADLKTGKRPPEIDVVAAQLAQANVEHQRSIDILKSDEAQYAAGGLPQTDLINARAAVASSAALSRQYQSDLDVAALPGRDEQIKAQASAISADQAALQQAAWKLQQKQIVSSQGGLVFDTLYQEGDWVSAGSPIIQMLPPENTEVRFFVSETVVGSLKLGQTVSVHCDGCAATVPSTITFISNQAEYTPPVIYSNETRAKLVFMIIAKPAPENAALLHPGQPIAITLP